MLIDTHAHLTWDSFKEDLDQVIDRAAFAGVNTIINIGADLPSSQDAAKLQCSKVKCYSTIGLHPDESFRVFKDVSIQEITRELEKMYLSNPGKIVAVGECGLDYFQKGLGGFGQLEELKKAQKELFQAQINLAKKLKLPLIVHCRNAWEDIPWKELAELSVVFHYFTGSKDIAQKIIAQGFYLSFSCVVTYPKNGTLREIIKITPTDKILTETDSPFSPPQDKRGQRNEPENIVEVVKVAADAKNLSFEQAAQAIYENTLKFFNIRAS